MIDRTRSGVIFILIIISVLMIGQIVWSEDDKTSEQKTYFERYTGADAEKLGSETCLVCHDDKFPMKVQNHINLIDRDPDNSEFGFGCETCHGPGGMHNGDIDGILVPEKLTSKESADLCSKCHVKLGSYRKNAWLSSDHFYSDLDCFSCHQGHSTNRSFLIEKTITDTCIKCHLRQKLEFNQRSHHPVNDGLLSCSSCHNAMSGQFEHQLVNEGDELCFKCHADKQGPFIFDMGIGTDVGGDGCRSCHIPHGSSTDSLLKYPRRLCLDCHSEMTDNAHFPGTCWQDGCHAEVMGSNSDPLFFE